MEKLALVIGINYDGTENSLGGCINDAGDITKKLVNEFEFKLEDVQLLIEKVATKKNILDGIERLVQELKEGDIGVVFYAGHGTQTADLPPIEEEDMLDEAIVPIDAIDNQENLIRDDEIHEKLSRLRKDVHFVVIFDSCHSGTATRLFKQGKARMIPLDKSVQEIKRIVESIRPSKSIFAKSHSLAGANHILLAGCRADQLSYDDGINGYFTRELTRYLKRGITYQELYEMVRKSVMERSENQQDPQIEGPLLTRKVFE